MVINSSALIVVTIVVLSILVVLVILGLREQRDVDPLEQRLIEFVSRGEMATLEEIEMSQSFLERVIIPVAAKFGALALKFTPQKALVDIERQLELAGNPNGLTPNTFFSARIFGSIGLFALALLGLSSSGESMFSLMNIGIMILSVVAGFVVPNMLLENKIKKRQKAIKQSLPDALDLLTICVEAGLGFEAAMKEVQDKWDNELSMAFGRVLQEVGLGKVRREALTDMADRIGANEMTSFVAAVVQSEQLGVSMSKVLRIQADDMRVKRRQRAEAEAQTAPVKMLMPMVFLIFPTILIILLGPAGLMIMRSGIGDMF